MDASDDVKSYLRKVSKESYSIFRNGFIGGGGASTSATPAAAPTPLSFPPRRLPMKKKRRSSSSDDDDDKSERKAIVPSDASAPQQLPARVNLAAKWLAMASFSPLALPLAALPTFEFIEETVQRFTAVRERIGQTRMGIELLQEATTASFVQGESWSDRGRAVQHAFGIHGVTISRESAVALLNEQEAHIASCGAPSLTEPAELRKWHRFLEGPHGPFAFGAPNVSLMTQIDHAHANTLLHTVITKLQRGARNQLPPQRKVDRHCIDESEGDDDAPSSSPQHHPTNDDATSGRLYVNEELDISAVADSDAGAVIFDINGSQQCFDISVNDERTKELLRFLRFLMPCGSAADNDRVPRSRGLGVWWYSAAAAVDLVVDPDTDRSLHDLFRGVCQHLKALYDNLHSTAGNTFPIDKRGALLEFLAQRHQQRVDTQVKHYWSVTDVDHHDVLAMHTLLVILAKVFHQNQNNLINL